jgi:hypothetical protein
VFSPPRTVISEPPASKPGGSNDNKGSAVQHNPTHLKKIDSLQVFRGLAALSVVSHHTAARVATFIGDMPAWLHHVFSLGFLGVDFFFVLSGFIIMSGHMDDAKTVSAMKAYGVKRVVRIFPPYWVASIATLASYALFPAVSQGNRDISLWSSLLLVPDYGAPALSVAWTLIHEAMFYLVFCVFFVSNRVFLGFVALWSVAIAVAAWTVQLEDLAPFWQRFLAPVNLEFVMGMGIAYLARRVRTAAAWPLVVTGVVSFVLLAAWPFSLECRALYGVPFSLLVLGAVLIEAHKRPAFPRWSILLGDASYSIYLVHNPLVGITTRIVSRIGPIATWSMGMAVGLACSVAIGVLYHFIVEKPLTGVFRRVARRFVAPAGTLSHS